MGGKRKLEEERATFEAERLDWDCEALDRFGFTGKLKWVGR
jgi:hypothetical protein